MRLAWLTDIHLNFVKIDKRRELYSAIREAAPDAVLLGGDIAEAPDVIECLYDLERTVEKPVYFVLGNHDFYRSSIADVHARMRSIASSNLVWLTDSGVQLLNEKTALIGDDGWADGRLGNYEGSSLFLNDFLLIGEFAELNKAERFVLLNQLGDAAAARIRTKLHEACTLRGRVLMLTHVPPFHEASWHEGQTSDEAWLPHFASKTMGETLIEVMAQHPDCRLEVLCGHTHGAGLVQINPQIVVKTGGAEYRKPTVQEVLEV